MNNYYTRTTPDFVPFTKARSGEVDNEFNAVVAGFDFLPTDQNALKRGRSTLFTTGGTGDAITITTGDSRVSYIDADEITWQQPADNTGAVTLNVDGLGAVSLQMGGQALLGGELIQGRFYIAKYDATNTVFQFINPEVSASSAAAAAASAAAAALSADAAQSWAIEAEDTPVPVIYGGDGVTTFSSFHWAQKSMAATSGGLIQGTGVVAPSAGTPYDYDAQISFENANNLQTATWGWDGTSQFEFNSLAHGATFALIGEDAAGTPQEMLFGDPARDVYITYAGSQRVATAADGAIVSAPSQTVVFQIDTIGAGFDTVLLFLDNGAPVYRVFHDENQSTIKHRMVNAGDVFRIEEGNGVNIAAEFTPNAGQSIRHAGAEVWQTLAAASGGMQINNTLTGAGFERVLTASDITGQFVPAGSVAGDTLDWSGAAWQVSSRLRTDLNDIEVLGSLNNDPTAGGNQNAQVNLFTSGGVATSRIGFSAGGNTELAFINRVHGGSILISQEDTAGTNRAIITADSEPGQNTLNSSVAGGWDIEYNSNVVISVDGANFFTVGDGNAEHFFRVRAPSTGLDAVNNSSLIMQYESAASTYLPLIRKAADNGGMVFSSDEGIAMAAGEAGTTLIQNQVLTAESVWQVADAEVIILTGVQNGWANRGEFLFGTNTGTLHYNGIGTAPNDFILESVLGNVILEVPTNSDVIFQENGVSFWTMDTSANTLTTTGSAAMTNVVGLQNFDSNSTSEFSFTVNGDRTFEIEQNGQVNVRADTATTTDQANIEFQDSAGTLLGQVGTQNTEFGMQLETNIASGVIELNARNAASTVREVAEFSGVGGMTVFAADNDSLSIIDIRNPATLAEISGFYIRNNVDGNLYPGGYISAVIEEQDSNTTLDNTTTGGTLHKDNSGTVTYTLANDSDIPFYSCWTVVNEQTGGSLTIATSGVTLRHFDGGGGAPPTGNRTIARAGVATIFKYTNSEYWIWGTGIT